MKLDDERGVVLVLALLFLAALGLLSAALVMTVQTEAKTSAAYKFGQQAFYVGNAGVQKSVVWFNNQYSPHLPASDYDTTQSPVQYSSGNVLLAGQTGSTSNYPESAVINSFGAALSNQSLAADASNSGIFSLDGMLLKYTPGSFLDQSTFVNYPSAIERWRIDSIGFWGSSADPLGTSQITAVIENSGNPLFDRALWGINSVSLNGNVLIDSYDPNLRPYGGSNVGELGALGTNGSASLSGSVEVHGDLSYGPSGSYSHSGGATVFGEVSQLSSPRVFPPIPSFTPGSQSISLSGTQTQTLGPGDYANISLSGQSVLTLTGGVYHINQLSQSGASTIIVSASTTLFIKSGMSLSGGSLLNSTQDPKNLAIFVAGTGSVSMSGNSAFYGSVYCPNAPLSLSGTSDFFGSFIAKSVSNSGTTAVHYDEGLIQEYMTQRPFRIINWSQSTF